MIRLWWYNYFARHFWYYYFNWRHPHLPRVCAGKITTEAIAWAKAAIAQRIEHEPSKLGVEGSNPSGRATPQGIL